MPKTHHPFLANYLVDPVSKSDLLQLASTEVCFENNSCYPMHQGIPILIDEKESIFSIESIMEHQPTTQDATYRKKGIKTFVRQKLLPSLSNDFNLHQRYTKLATEFKLATILIIGAGDKVNWYREIFKGNSVITSDVHCQFSPDIVMDAHQIPFKANSFDLVIAGQVLEHCFKPWLVAQEIERITKEGGKMLIEVPFNFPYHSPPYDFFRFTFTGLRSLFPQSQLITCEIGEGNASTVAIYTSQWLVDLFSNRLLRGTMLFISRILLGWLKYVDKCFTKINKRTISIPKGFSMLFEKDNLKRSNKDLLKAFYDLER